MRSTTPSSEMPAAITAPTKPLAFQANQGTPLGAILVVVAVVHALVIVLLLSHFGWLSGSDSEADPDASAGQSGIVIPVTLETAEHPEKAVPPAPEPEPQLLPEPAPETKPEPEPEAKPAPELKTQREPETPAAEPFAEKKKETQATPAKPPAPAVPESPLQSNTKRGGTNTNTNTSSSDNESSLSTQGTQSLPEPIALALTPAQVDPNYLHRPNPVYPALSKRLREEGTVVLRVNLDAQGVVQDITIEKSSDAQRLDQAALEAVRQWRFIPAKRGQQAVPSTALVPIEFKHR